MNENEKEMRIEELSERSLKGKDLRKVKFLYTIKRLIFFYFYFNVKYIFIYVLVSIELIILTR